MKDSNKIVVPKLGWQQELARLAGCSTRTVYSALHNGTGGEKSERVRRLYRAKYCRQHNDKISF